MVEHTHGYSEFVSLNPSCCWAFSLSILSNASIASLLLVLTKNVYIAVELGTAQAQFPENLDSKKSYIE